PKVVRIAIPGGVNTLNPLLSSNVVENAVAALCCDLLIETDDHQSPVPRLAAEVPTLENGGISKDGLSITYHLRRNVKWHDGVPFTSKDVAFSWAALMNPKNNVISRRGYDLVSRVDTPDPYTAIFRLKERFAPAVLTLFSESDQPYRIVPEHVLAKLPDLNAAEFNQHPIGTGPFKFVSWQRGNQIEYAANPDYYLGPPKLDGILVKELPDQNTMAIQLRTHAVDFMNSGSAAFEMLRDAPGVTRKLVDYNAYVGLLLNVSSPALRDVAVRRAIAYALDVDAITARLTFGTATPATGDLPAFMWAYEPNVRRYRYDPAAARKLLGGRKPSLVLYSIVGSTTAKQLDVQVQSMLRDVGIALEVREYGPGMLTAPGGPLRTGKFQIVNWGWVGGADPDDSSQFMCDQVPPQGNNFARYCNAAVDRAERVATTSYVRAVRKRAYSEIQRRIADDVPMVFLYWPKQRLAYSSALEGVRSNGETETWNVNEWSLR
ncbi:MAG: peptide ABC transporter substrate-binding protein, partial [Candidatus Eremiobacteraeota bacterium]|nr:peptide ABC transporter substrate-binding protein [Candidatus Eremiobacteraeota bacterium]